MLRAFVLVTAVLFLGGCTKKITQTQCDELLDHFADLVVKEHHADAGADTVITERARERQEAKNAEFKNCTSEVQTGELSCAMKAQSSEAIIKCLE